MALLEGGEVLSFGNGDHGHLGHGNTENQLVPKAIEQLRGKRLVDVYAGEQRAVLEESGKTIVLGAESDML